MLSVYSLKPPGYEVFVLTSYFVVILTQEYALDSIRQSLNLKLPLFMEQYGQIKTSRIPQTSVPPVKIHSEHFLQLLTSCQK